MWWTNSLCTLANEDLGTLAEYDPLTLSQLHVTVPGVGSERSTLCASANEESDTLADNNPLTGYEPNVIDKYQISETTEMFIQESSSDSRPSNLHDSEISDYTIGIALSSPLFTQEREHDASHTKAYHSHDEGLSSSQSSSVGHDRTVRPVVEQFDSQISHVREIPSHSSES